TVTAQKGTTIRVTVNINRIGGFTGNVTVTPPDPAMHINPKPPAPIATTDTSVTFKLRIKGGAPLRPHQETFTAHDDSGHTIAVTLTVIVQQRGEANTAQRSRVEDQERSPESADRMDRQDGRQEDQAGRPS